MQSDTMVASDDFPPFQGGYRPARQACSVSGCGMMDSLPNTWAKAFNSHPGTARKAENIKPIPMDTAVNCCIR